MALHEKFAVERTHNLGGLGAEIVSQLVMGTWTSLVELSVSGCGLKAQALSCLSQGNWPGLEFLDVSDNCLDAEGMASLAKGNWPLLDTANFSFNPTMDTVAVAHLSAANWPLATLMMSYMPVSADMAIELAELQLPHLESLCLDIAGLAATAVSELARADWPSLRYLSFRHNDICALGVRLGLDLYRIQEAKFDVYGRGKVQQRHIVSRPGDVCLWPHLNFVRISAHEIVLLDKQYAHLS